MGLPLEERGVVVNDVLAEYYSVKPYLEASNKYVIPESLVHTLLNWLRKVSLKNRTNWTTASVISDAIKAGGYNHPSREGLVTNPFYIKILHHKSWLKAQNRVAQRLDNIQHEFVRGDVPAVWVQESGLAAGRSLGIHRLEQTR